MAAGHSNPAATLIFQLKALNLPTPETEYLFANKGTPWAEIDRPRLWRFDLAWPHLMTAVEVNGGVHNQGRHVRGKGFTADCEKRTAANMTGWVLLEFTPDQIKSGQAARLIEHTLRPAWLLSARPQARAARGQASG